MEEKMEEHTGIITMKGNPLTLVGNLLKVGESAPEFEILDNDLTPVKLSSFRGKVFLIILMPHLVGVTVF
jgi:thiol peroxidase